MDLLSAFREQLRQGQRLLWPRGWENSTSESRSAERYRRVALTTTTAAIATITRVAVGIFSVPLAVGYLGPERYGMWMTVSSLIAMLQFADFGIGNGLLNAISEADGKGDNAGARRAVTSALLTLIAIALVIGGLFATAYWFVPWPRLFNVSGQAAVAEAGPLVASLMVMFCVNLPLGVIQRIQMGYQEGYRANLWALAGNLVSLGLLLLAIRSEARLPILVIMISGGQTLGVLANGALLFFRDRRSLIPSRSSFHWATGRRLLGTGAMFFLITILSLLGNSSDGIIIAQVLGSSAVAHFSITQRLFSLNGIIQLTLFSLWPAFGEAMARNDVAWARRTLWGTARWTLAAGLFVSVVLVLFGKPIVRAWVGPEFVPSTVLLLGFSLLMLYNNFAGTLTSFLNSGPYFSRQLLPMVFATIASIFLKLVLAKTWYVEGVVFGTLLSFGTLFLIPITLTVTAILNENHGNVRN